MRKPKLPATFAGKSTQLGRGGRFAMVEAQAAKSGATNPAAVAASAGRKSLGQAKMTRLAVAGKKRKKKTKAKTMGGY